MSKVNNKKSKTYPNLPPCCGPNCHLVLEAKKRGGYDGFTAPCIGCPWYK